MIVESGIIEESRNDMDPNGDCCFCDYAFHKCPINCIGVSGWVSRKRRKQKRKLLIESWDVWQITSLDMIFGKIFDDPGIPDWLFNQG